MLKVVSNVLRLLIIVLCVFRGISWIVMGKLVQNARLLVWNVLLRLLFAWFVGMELIEE